MQYEPKGNILTYELTWEDWEQAAAQYMQQIGFADAEVTLRGADGGIDIWAREAVAQVKARNTATPRPEVQQLHGAALAENKRGLFFSLSGYTAGAIEWAEAAGVALFVLESTGTARPLGTNATMLVAGTAALYDDQSESETFSSLLAESGKSGFASRNLLVHFPSGEKGPTQGRSLAQIVANFTGKPLRVVNAASVGEGGTVIGLIRLIQHLVPGEIVYLDQIEHFPDWALTTLLTAFCGHLQFEECDDVLDNLTRSQDLALTLRRLVESAQESGVRMPHILLSGPPGMGKLAHARIVADALGSKLIATSGPALRNSNDLSLLLLSLYLLPLDDNASPPVLFIDEIERLPAAAAELLGEVLAHSHLPMNVGESAATRIINLSLVPFVCIASMTEPGALAQPICDHFGFHQTMSPYSATELAMAVEQIWDQADFRHESGSSLFIAEWAKGIPQRALHLARLMLQIKDGRVFSVEHATQVLKDFNDYDDFSDVDWLLLGLQNKSVKANFGKNSDFGEWVSMLPHTTVIASTGIRWSRNRDARDAFGSLRGSFRILVMPEIRSTGETMLGWEMAHVPLIE